MHLILRCYMQNIHRSSASEWLLQAHLCRLWHIEQYQGYLFTHIGYCCTQRRRVLFSSSLVKLTGTLKSVHK